MYKLKKEIITRIYIYSLVIIIIPTTVFSFRSLKDYFSYQYSFTQILPEDETHCKYVSTNGLSKMCMQTKNCIFIRPDSSANFEIPTKQFVLVTNYEDLSIPDDLHSADDLRHVAKALSSPYLIKWFSKNVTQETDKLKLIPIGLDYHSVSMFPQLNLGPVESPLKQEQTIEKLNKKPFYERQLKIYCNFLHAIRGRYGIEDRARALEQVPPELLVAERTFVPRYTSWKNLVKYAFVLSPAGNGLDCYRTWEALALGSIPIVKSGPLDSLYDDLPVLIVKEWSDVSEDLLKATIEDFKTKQFKYEKLTLKYWTDQFKS